MRAPAPMQQFLPPRLRQWVADRAAQMGLPGPDDYILLLIRLEKQRLELAVSGTRSDHESGPRSL